MTSFQDIARRNSAWHQAYKNTAAGRGGVVPTGVAMPSGGGPDLNVGKPGYLGGGRFDSLYRGSQRNHDGLAPATGGGPSRVNHDGVAFAGAGSSGRAISSGYTLESLPDRPAARPDGKADWDSIVARAMKDNDLALQRLREYTSQMPAPRGGATPGVLADMAPAASQWAQQQMAPAPTPAVAPDTRSSFKRWYDSQVVTGPSAEAMRGARQRLAAEQLGGLPVARAAAVFQGRQDARDILARASVPKSPAETVAVHSPLGADDAANFRALADIESGRLQANEQQYIDWENRRDALRSESLKRSPYAIPIYEGLSEKLGRAPTDQEMHRAMQEFSGKYTVYSKGKRGSADKMSPSDFAYRMLVDPNNAEINGGIEAARTEAAASRFAQNEDRDRRAARLSAQRMFEARGVLPSDPEVARSIVAGQAMAGNPFAARLSESDAAARTALQQSADASRTALQQSADALAASRFAAEMGLKGKELDAGVATADAEARRVMAQTQFDARLKQMEQENALRMQQIADSRRAADMGVAMDLRDPVAVANTVYEAKIKEYQSQGYPTKEAEQRARVEARGAYDAAMSQANVARGFGVAVPEYGAFPDQFAYTPPRVDPGLNDQVRTATVDDLVKLYQAAAVKGEKLTPQRLKEVAAANGLYVDDSVINSFHDSAQWNRGMSSLGMQWLFGDGSPYSDEAYSGIYGGSPVGSTYRAMGFVPPHMRQ